MKCDEKDNKRRREGKVKALGDEIMECSIIELYEM
jgi:hypothetical protein